MAIDSSKSILVRFFCVFELRTAVYILGPSYIRTNQSAIYSRKEQEIEIKHEHNDIHSKVKKQLVDYPSYIPSGNKIFEIYSNELLAYLQQVYFTSLSFKDHMQAKEQANIFASIRKKLNNII